MSRFSARRLRLLAHPRIAFGATLVVGLIFAIAAALWQADGNARTAQRRFDALAGDAVERLAVRLRSYEYGLQAARGMVLANGPDMIGGQPFARFVAGLDLSRQYPGLRDLGLVWRVAPDKEADFIARLRAGGDPEFRVREAAPHPGDHYVTAFVAPRAASGAATGFDLASELQRRGVAETAMRTGVTSISAPVAQFGASGPAQHFLLMLPIYAEGTAARTADERATATVGWIATALLMDTALANLGLEDPRFTLLLRDAADPRAAPFFGTNGGVAGAAKNAASTGIVRRIELPVYGRSWRATFRASPRFLTDLDLPDPRGVAAFGTLLAAAIATVMHALALARRREHQVHSEQARRAAIVDGSADAIICQSLDGTVTDWNLAAERLFGYPAGDTFGRRLSDLPMLPPGRQAEDAEIRAALLQGDPVVTFDTVRRHRDGTLVDVSLSASPILRPDGRCIGVTKTLRDISAARRAADELRELNASLERRVAERTALLEAARHDLQAILDALPTAIAYWDSSLHNRFRNRAHRRWFGDDPAHRPGMHITELLGDEYSTRVPEVTAALRGEANVCERESRTPGSSLPLYTVNHYLPDLRHGEVQGFYVMGHDVTAAKLAEQRLRASEEFLDRAGEIAGVGGWALDLRTMTLAWSAHTYRIHEVDRTTPPDLAKAIDFYPPEARPVIARAVEQGIAAGTPWDLELPLITATGRHLWVRSQGAADMENGRAVRLIGAFQDITERKQAAASLEQAHARFAIAADSAHIGVWEYDLRTDSSVWDERMYRLYGLPPFETVDPHRIWASRLHPDDLERVRSAGVAALRGERTCEIDYRVLWPNGEVRHLRASALLMRDAQGTALRMTGVNIDITEQKRAELELIETSSLLHTVLDSASEVSIIAGDPDMNITVFNTGAERLLGYTAEELIGRTGAAVRIHDREEVAARAEEMSRELGRPVQGMAVFTEPGTLGQPREWTYRRKDGSRVRVSLIVTAMRDAAGGLLGYLGIAHDVTRQKQQEESLREAMNKARQASLAKSQFLANVSHEIRTPMNAVVGLTYLLGQSTLDPHQADMVAKLRIAGKSLLGIINDVLDLSKIEADELTLERAPFALRGVLSDLSALMSLQAGAKGIRYSVDAPAGLPLVLDGDATRLGQVLTNLVANAIKFTERGGVKLSVGWRTEPVGTEDALPAGPATARLRFTVRDSGIGIARELQSRLFAPFVQADASTKRRFGGTGLGLSIVKRLVTLMGGTVWMESLEGVGSTFTVDLDLPVLDVSVPDETTTQAPKGRSLQGVRILLTDDSELNLEVASRILMRHGAQITLAHDGQQAVDLLRARPGGFDLVLMDVQMPVLDGHEATLCIRNDLGLKHLPVIALTAGALTGEHKMAGEAAMTDFIRKPFDANGLVRTVLRHARPHLAQPVALGLTTWGDSGRTALTCSGDSGDGGTSGTSATGGDDSAHLGDNLGVNRGDDSGGDGWPEILGIDRADVQLRLGGDLDLFASMLQRLLREFAEIGQALGAAGDADSADLSALAARMHKLKGSASTLGATSISRLAARTEAACRAHQGERARQSTLELQGQLKSLTLNASAVLGRLQSAALARREAAPVPTADHRPQRLRDLLTLFEGQSLGAVDRFADAAPELRHLLGERAMRRLQDHVDNLRFEEAAQMLRPLAGATAAPRIEAAENGRR